MKSKFSRVTLLILLLALVVTTLLVPTSAFAATTPTGYTSASDVVYKNDGSKIYNWGVRNETATFLTTYANNYYTGSNTFENLSAQGKDELLTSLRSLMKSTHKTDTTYDNCKNYAKYTDCQKNDGSVILLYTSYVASSSDFSASAPGWNREHVWPKSLGGFSTSGPGADVHHIRPDDVTTNSNRGNKKYGNVSGGTTSTGTLASSMVGGTYNSNYYEPLDNVKGDVARICLYMYTRYGADYSKCSSITNVFQSVDVLLDWMEKDPVDTWEMGRNDSCQSLTGSRNVFIDYPEYAWLLFGKDVPENYATPSHNSGTVAPNPDGGGSTGGNTGGNTGDGGSTTTPVETVHEGTQTDPYTIADALAVGGGLTDGGNNGKVVYVKGTVKSFETATSQSSGSSYFKNVVIYDESTSSTFTLNTANPQATTDGNVKVGDTILAWGYIRINNKSGLPEMGTANSTLVNFSIVTDTTGDGGSTGGNTGDGGSTTTPVQPVHEGTQTDPYTIADALAVGGGLTDGGNNGKVVYVKGTVKSFETATSQSSGSSYFKNVVIYDESTSSTFTLNTANPQATTDGKVKVGDTILAWGYIRINNKSGLPEMGTANSTLVNFFIVTDTTGDGGNQGGTDTPDITYTITSTQDAFDVTVGATVDFKTYFTITDSNGQTIKVTDDMISAPDKDLTKEGSFIVTCSYGGSSKVITVNVKANNSGTDTPVTPDEKVVAFQNAVADIANAITINAKFVAIKTAVTAYNSLTSAQKQQVSSEIETLKTAISNYNTAVTTQNDNSSNALLLVLQVVTATVTALAVAIITKKVLF